MNITRTLNEDKKSLNLTASILSAVVSAAATILLVMDARCRLAAIPKPVEKVLTHLSESTIYLYAEPGPS